MASRSVPAKLMTTCAVSPLVSLMRSPRKVGVLQSNLRKLIEDVADFLLRLGLGDHLSRYELDVELALVRATTCPRRSSARPI